MNELPGTHQTMHGHGESGAAGSTVRAAPEPQSMAAPSLTERELFRRLGWFIKIRWSAGVGTLVILLFALLGFEVPIPPGPVVFTIFGLFFYNAIFLMLVEDAYRRHHVTRRFILWCGNAQIVCDLLAVAVLIHFSGGVENPFIVFFICPVVVAADLLPERNAYAHAVLAALLIHTIAWLELAGLVPHVHLGDEGAISYDAPMAVAKLTATLTVLLFATVFLGTSIAGQVRRRGRELEEALERVGQTERSKSFLMLRASHDLRAPVGALISLLRAALMAADGEASRRVTKLVGRAEQRAVGLNNLIDELHHYATLREAAASLPRQQLDLADVANQVVRTYRPLAEEKGVRLRPETEPVRLDANREAMVQLMGNLVTNAIQYTPPSGEISVQVQLDDTASAARISVADTGIGIPADVLDRIFDEFYRAGNAKEHYPSGTGLGLSIVERLAASHGGRIEVSSEPGRGSTFTVILPLDTSEESGDTARP